MFSSITRARAINTRIALATTKKGDLSITEYISKMRTLGDEMANAGKPLDDNELVSYILTGIDSDDYNPVITSLITSGTGESRRGVLAAAQLRAAHGASSWQQ